jgi:hypothetical protein
MSQSVTCRRIFARGGNRIDPNRGIVEWFRTHMRLPADTFR